MSPILKSKRVVLLCLVAALGALSYISVNWFFGHVAYNQTHSLRETFFWLQEPKAIQRGEFVTFMKSHPKVNQGEAFLFIKNVACKEGDFLKAEQGKFTCNHTFLGEVDPHLTEKLKLKTFEFKGVIPNEQYFVTGDKQDSYDSRYYGFIHQKEIHAKSNLAF